MISLETYFMGRDLTHAAELTDEIRANAEVTVARVNELLACAGRSDIHAVASGWRTRGINAATANSAANSKHLTARAADLPDADRNLATWCVDNLDVLRDIGLWMEDPRFTKTWVHLQTVPPPSGRTVFIPNSGPPSDPDFPVTWI